MLYVNITPDISIVCKACIVKTHNRVDIWDVSVVNRQNTIRLEEKERREKELLSQILVQADEYKVEFHRKRQASSETKRVTNREKEQVRTVVIYYNRIVLYLMRSLVFMQNC